jgi:SinI restriction endonuclease
MVLTFDDIIATRSEEAFLQIFHGVFADLEIPTLEAHQVILSACYRNPGLSPGITANTPEALAAKWLRKYQSSYEGRISQRLSRPPGTVVDPIIDTILSARLIGLTALHLEQIKYAHRLSMSAENILGLLLEEFLAEQLADYGWFCGWGEVIRHVDFCNRDGALLQIKNRSNSENSSSSRVRINQPIEKWYRVNAKTGLNQWSYFNQKYETERFSEQCFIAFVQELLARNPSALPIEKNNPWEFFSQPSDSQSSD